MLCGTDITPQNIPHIQCERFINARIHLQEWEMTFIQTSMSCQMAGPEIVAAAKDA